MAAPKKNPHDQTSLLLSFLTDPNDSLTPTNDSVTNRMEHYSRVPAKDGEQWLPGQKPKQKPFSRGLNNFVSEFFFVAVKNTLFFALSSSFSLVY